jgi:cardiolipin synthase A/B
MRSVRNLVYSASLVVLAGACASSSAANLWQHPIDVPHPGTEAFDAALLQATGVGLQGGHHVHLVQNGKVFDEVVELIGQAEQSVHIVLYIWRQSPPSDRVLEALAARRKGVRCLVLVDTLGSLDFGEQIAPELERLGCEGRLFRPLSTDAAKLTYRQHRKLVIIDGRKGLTGGFGIWDSWTGDGVSSEDDWRDTNVTVEGPAVRQMQVAFAQSWNDSGGLLLPPEDFPTLEPSESGVRSAFVASEARKGRTSGDRLMQLAIASARERIWLSNAYFVPNEEILRLLEMKARGGVDVRLVVSGPVHDWKSILAAQRATYERLLGAGVRIFEYQPSMMHSKSGLIDDRLTLIGSMNLDPFSLDRSEEGTLVVEDAGLAREMASWFEKDAARSQEITAGNIPGTSAFHRLSNFVLGIFRRGP